MDVIDLLLVCESVFLGQNISKRKQKREEKKKHTHKSWLHTSLHAISNIIDQFKVYAGYDAIVFHCDYFVYYIQDFSESCFSSSILAFCK